MAQEVAYGLRATERHNVNTLSAKISITSLGERLERDPVAGPPDKHNGAQVGGRRERSSCRSVHISYLDSVRRRRCMAYEELKQRQSVMWGRGPYQRITETITDIHEVVVERLAPESGDRWLDLACGTGAVAERACAAGAQVTGLDLAPVLIETAKERAAELGLEIEYVVGDLERLEFPDASFDKVSSTCGIMFAPDHEAAARELARVTAPGGRIALANWTPTGGLAKMFKVMAPYQPAPPPSSPFDWGDERRVRELLGEWFELELEEHVSTLRVPSGEAYWELFSTSYGPTKVLADSLGDRREELHRDWVDFFETNYRVDGEIAHTREYLLVLGRRR
jgi:ubiquinone/menaquinone biosynthesis C-methylase UbiE